MSSILQFLEDMLLWFVDFVVWVFHKWWELITDGLAAVIEAIPVPAWAEGNPLSGIPPEVAFFLDGFKFPEGLAIVIGAFAIRFMIRRLPFVG